ncbi:MAG: Rho termination factor N-terminal domain-containing protein, partial [Phycisphaerales bacterium]|nr:Rho termination factor N-terminal domain-containing protein [Phycisphaerales bacterium]
MAKKRRRRKKSGNNGGLDSMTLNPGEVPTDEELEAEVAVLDEKLTKAAQKKYDEAKKEGFDLAALQHMKSKELGVVAKKEKVDNWAEMPRQKLVFEILKAQAKRQG